MAKDTNAVQLYYEAVNDLLGDLVKEGISLDEVLKGLIAENSESARAKEQAIYEVKLQMAQDRLKRLQSSLQEKRKLFTRFL